MTMAGDPQRKVKTVKIIAISDMCIATFSTFFHIWLLIWAANFPGRIQIYTGQVNGAVYFGFILMVVMHSTLFGFSWKLLSGAKMLSVNPIITIKAGKRWKNWSICSLILFIVLILLPLVLASGKRVNEGPTQLYLVYLLLLLSFRGYGIWYLGKFTDDILCFNAGPDNRIYFVPSPAVLKK